MLNNVMEVNAVETVNLLPWYTYAKNEIKETRIGAEFQSAVNMTELRRARQWGRKVVSIDDHRLGQRSPTLDDPAHLDSSRIHHSVNPSFLPRKELDKLDGANEFIKDTHTLITGRRDAFLDADGTLHDITIQGPSDQHDNKSCKRRKAKEAMHRLSPEPAKLEKKTYLYKNTEAIMISKGATSRLPH